MHVANAAEHYANNHARRLTASLRRHAWKSGWPTRLARKLSVSYSEDGYKVQFPAHLADEIHAQEFGGLDRPPSPAISRFINRMDSHSRPLDKEYERLAHEVGII